MLDGYKTYIIAVLLGVLAVVAHLGYIDPETTTLIEAILLGGGIAALRAGVAKTK